MGKKGTITVQGREITVITAKENDYISLTDMAGYKDELEARVVVSNWMSTRFTLEFLGIWEKIYNPNFNRMEFHTIKNSDGRLVLTPKRWVERTNAIGIFSKSGRYGGGIFAHKDIAFEFGSWLSAEFKFYLIREFQRLKEEELQQKSLEWNLQRTLSKINYRIHTDAIKDEIIPKTVTREQAAFVYANEADLLNVALFGKTAKQWYEQNPNKEGNIRDYATLEQLVVLSNMESINALLIRQGIPQGERLMQLNNVAITQMHSLVSDKRNRQLHNARKPTKQRKGRSVQFARQANTLIKFWKFQNSENRGSDKGDVCGKGRQPNAAGGCEVAATTVGVHPPSCALIIFSISAKL